MVMEPTQRDSFPWITWDSNSEDFQQQLRQIFNLCDEDRDGVVTAGEFRRATQQHLGTEVCRVLIHVYRYREIILCNDNSLSIM